MLRTPTLPRPVRRANRTAGLALALTLAAGMIPPTASARPAAPPSSAAAPLPALAGSQWRLVQILSMDDAVGSAKPVDPSRYTLQLGVDGKASLRLDCNRGMASWSAQASAEPTSGSFLFGPLATTRAYCPPPSLSQRLTDQIPYVRSYLIRNGRLHLALMADGGILEWEPLIQTGYLSQPDRELESALLRASPSYRKDVIAAGGSGNTRYVYARTDLNGDGKEEVFVYLMGSYFCGSGGCNLQLFTRTPSGYRLVNDFPISRLPIIVAPNRSRGWNDLWQRQSGGGAPATYVRQVFDGRRYVEKERVPAVKTPQGRAVLTGDPSLSDGVPLVPGG
jgi:heat shock protein HslJ